MMKRLLSTLCVAAGLMASASVSAQTAQLVYNENAVGQTIAGKLITDIYKKAGMSATAVPVPGVRANAMALSGEKDGEAGRIGAYYLKNPSLIKVEPSHYYLSSSAFAKKDKGIVIKSKEDLKKYKVGIVRGIAHGEAATEGMQGVQLAASYEQLYKMLDGDRIDVVVDEGISGPILLKKMGLNNTIGHVGEIARLDLYHSLNPSKKDWAPKISATIKAMKDSGELDKLVKRYEEDAMK